MTTASILKKVVMAITGLIWLGFVITHLTANFLMFKGAEVFNAYPELLKKTGALLYVAEAGLVVFLLAHVYSGFKVSLENKAARGKNYEVTARGGRSSFASRSMPIGGLVLLIFLVAHVWMFKFGDWSGPNGLHGLVMKSFRNELIVGGYVIAMAALGLHLSHGFSSAFQTLGALKPAWSPKFKQAGVFIGWLIAIGFASIPIWAYIVARSNS